MRLVFEEFHQSHQPSNPLSQWKIYLDYLLFLGFILLILLVVYPSCILRPLAFASLQFFNQTFLANMGFLIVFLWMFVVIGQHQEWSEMGMLKSKLLPALKLLGCLWGFILAFDLLVHLIFGISFQWDSSWNFPSFHLGLIISQWFGVAVIEEIFFRGIMLVMFSYHFSKKIHNNAKALLMAAFWSSFLFSIMHIPVRILYGTTEVDLILSLLTLFWIGFYLALIYITTNNIFVAIGVHALNNYFIFIWVPFISIIWIEYLIVGLYCFQKEYVKHKTKKKSKKGTKNEIEMN